MCVIIDTNCFTSVMDPASKHHQRFVPIFNWLLKGKCGRLIYGGTKYKTEVDFKKTRFRGLLAELERKGRLLPLSDEQVDRIAATVKRLAGNDPDFDDEHIVAIVIASKCRVVCTDDKRSMPYLKRRSLYPKHVDPPKIYQSRLNSKLCCENNVADICRCEQ